MTDIDDRIRQALSAEDRALMDAIGDEQTIFDLIGRSFRGRMKALMVIAWVAMFAMFAFAVLSAVQLLAAPDVDSRINWAVALVVSTQFLLGMKMWYFLELNRLATARDIRRLELRMMANAGPRTGG
ncbi:MAG: hypothetical protein KJP18_05015 [Gemmatimonadetes bacterium]|nr:hypothetical protein [Gemmatimonadota bacterium]NNF38551.1 hypothetical protein [Gemmatimonadota bacterium]NNK62730.1 hypothetical protein [Gemmatimonadota bacterium]